MSPDRMAGLGGVATALGLAAAAANLYVPYQYEPLGPAVFPYLVAAALCVAGVFLIVRPDPTTMRVGVRQIGVLLMLLGYAYVFESVGYLVTTAFTAFGLGMVLGQRAMRAAVAAVLVSVSTYALLVGILDLNLPTGWVWLSLVSAG